MVFFNFPVSRALGQSLRDVPKFLRSYWLQVRITYKLRCVAEGQSTIGEREKVSVSLQFSLHNCFVFLITWSTRKVDHVEFQSGIFFLFVVANRLSFLSFPYPAEPRIILSKLELKICMKEPSPSQVP